MGSMPPVVCSPLLRYTLSTRLGASSSQGTRGGESESLVNTDANNVGWISQMTSDETVIKSSTVKILALTLGAFAFVAVGLWLWSIAETQVQHNATFLKCVSIAGIGFFGLCGVYGVRKLFDSSPGLIVNQHGIYDNSSAVAGDLIKWTDITGVEVGQVRSTRFLLIFVRNPEDVLKKANWFSRFWMTQNARLYGTPLSISANSLQCTFDELLQLVKQGLKTHSA